MAKIPIPPIQDPPGDNPDDSDYSWEELQELFLRSMNHTFGLNDAERTYLTERIQAGIIDEDDMRRAIAANPDELQRLARDQSARSHGGHNPYWYHSPRG